MTGNQGTSEGGMKESIPSEITLDATGNAPAPLQSARCAPGEQGTQQHLLQVFDYVRTPQGTGVIIHLWPQIAGVILDATQELAYFERPEDIEQIQPITFLPVPSAPDNQQSMTFQEDEYQYLDPYSWPYNDPAMTDEYLIACGFPTRQVSGYLPPMKPEHVERLRGVRFVSTPKGKGKLWRNWDTQVGVILEGTQRVTFFYTPEEWMQVLPIDNALLGIKETKTYNMKDPQ
jgi:hypothetical protein